MDERARKKNLTRVVGRQLRARNPLVLRCACTCIVALGESPPDGCSSLCPVSGSLSRHHVPLGGRGERKEGEQRKLTVVAELRLLPVDCARQQEQHRCDPKKRRTCVHEGCRHVDRHVSFTAQARAGAGEPALAAFLALLVAFVPFPFGIKETSSSAPPLPSPSTYKHVLQQRVYT